MILSNQRFNWLDLIPNQWEIDKVKDHFYFSDIQTENFENYPVLSLTMSGVKKRNVDTNEGQLPETYENYNLVDSSCLVFNPMDLISGWVDVPQTEGLISPSYRTIKSRSEETNLHFIKYYFQSLYREKVLFHFGEGVHYEYRWGLGKETLKNFPIPIPPKEEQEEIVSYLDNKTNQINELIKKTELKIEQLKEQRDSIIDEVVTQGLNPNVEKKESCVEWIGEIPSHWKISKLKYLVSENQESLSNSTDPDLELDYIEISDVNSIGEFKKPTKYIFSESPSRCRRICRKGDVIISTVRTYLKSIGIIEEQRENLICSTGFSVLTPKSQYLSKYIFYMLRSNWFISKIISRSEGVSYPSIQSHKLLGTDVIIMDKQEQQKIVEFLDEETQKIDKTIYKEEKRIELLKDYKQSLISEVVTGKKRVV